MTHVASLVSRGALFAALLGTALPASAADRSGHAAICTVRDSPAAMGQIIPVSMPPLAEIQGLTGSAVVRIDLDASGAAHNPTIVKSTGYVVLDRAALASVYDQTFTPELHDCAAVGGAYDLAVEFVK